MTTFLDRKFKDIKTGGWHTISFLDEPFNFPDPIELINEQCGVTHFLDKSLALWKLKDLKEIIVDINKTEILCKKNPHVSASIFLNFFMEICKKANSFS